MLGGANYDYDPGKAEKRRERVSFYAVFSDHKLPVQSIVVVVLNVVGKVHPRFHRYLARISIQTSAKLQCEQGALFSSKAEQNLEKLSTAECE